jgi:hypothetical protein
VVTLDFGVAGNADDAGDVVRSRLVVGSACVFRPSGHDHAHLGRNLVQALGAILADDVQRAAATLTHLAVGLDHHLFRRQMIEALVAAGSVLSRAFGFEPRIGLLLLRLSLGARGLKLNFRVRYCKTGGGAAMKMSLSL